MPRPATGPADADGPDVYFKKRIAYRWNNEPLLFDVGHTLFSSFQIDEGSDLLLRLIDANLPTPDTPRQILDLGCGCGVLGIALARRFPDALVTLVDKDLLAVRYARHNCHLNGATNTTVVGSVGLEQVPVTTYDMIVTNIPAKIGDAAIEQEFLCAPLARLRPGGVFWCVVVSGLNRLLPAIAVRQQLRLKEMRKRAGHTVYRLVQPASPEPASPEPASPEKEGT